MDLVLAVVVRVRGKADGGAWLNTHFYDLCVFIFHFFVCLDFSP